MFRTARTELIRRYTFPVWAYFRKVLEAGREQGVFRFRSLDHTFMSLVGAILYQNKADYFAPLLGDAEAYTDNLIEELTAFILHAIGISTPAADK
ncbi:hypothetical protein [uncultured Paenibacillus sp.]|uniref:hypothetical protein n=1 Tax=uncultured Paenibacillus sp. TaxID=227322 RepID=UPI0028D0BB24|nr:hypothetical protein [uncultured Paenibacillus sp.]